MKEYKDRASQMADRLRMLPEDITRATRHGIVA